MCVGVGEAHLRWKEGVTVHTVLFDELLLLSTHIYSKQGLFVRVFPHMDLVSYRTVFATGQVVQYCSRNVYHFPVM